MSDQKYPHSGHRQRLRERFLQYGSVAIRDYEALELLLFYAIPRRDVQPIARELLRRFGTVQNALEAEPEELMKIPGLGKRAAELLHFVPGFIHQYLHTTARHIARPVNTTQDIVNLLAPRLLSLQEPAFFAIPLNRVKDAIAVQRIPQGEAALTPIGLVERISYASASAIVVVEATDLPLDDAYSRRVAQIHSLAEKLAIAQFPLVDYCQWSLSGREMVSFRACGALPEAVMPAAYLFN